MRDTLFRAIWPAGLIIDTVTTEANRITINAHPAARDAACPDCGVTSGHVHSRYERRLLDLPSHGRSVHLLVRVRRFRCANRDCQRQIFGEPLPDSTARRAARRTSRLEAIVHHLGVALGGRPAASLARRLMLPVSKDTLLRVVRRRAPPVGADTVRVLGIDDFAWKRGQRYGTLLCDLEQRRIIDLLPDREAGTVEAWLADHPEITKISRDRGGGYGQAATKAAPQAVQIADRWHLMENASAAFLDAVRRSMRPIRQVLGSTVTDPSRSPAPSASSMTAIFGDRRATRRSNIWPTQAPRSRKSPAEQVTAASSFAACCAVRMATCSGAGKACCGPSSAGLVPSGRRVVATAPSYGGAYAPPASKAACGL